MQRQTRPGAEARKLRYAILVDGLFVETWQYDAIATLQKAGIADLALVVVNDSDPGQRNLRGKLPSLLFRLYFRFYVRRRSTQLRRLSLDAIIDDVPVVRSKVIRKGRYSEYFATEDIELLREKNLDFIIRFGFGILRGEVLDVARHGIWSFHHDDERIIRGGPPCFWEIQRGDPVTGSILQRITSELDRGHVLVRGNFPTHPYSYTRNLDNAYRVSSTWIVKAATKIYLTGKLDEKPPSKQSGRLYTHPGTLAFCWFLFRCAYGFAATLASRLAQIELWNVGITTQTFDDIVRAGALDPTFVEWLPTPRRGEFLADPFLFQSGGETVILAEAFEYGGKANIVEIRHWSMQGMRCDVAIETDLHFSYPFVFEHDKQLYCAPESFESGALTYYRLDGGSWIPERTSLQGERIVDPTILEYEGRFWLFCTHADDMPDVQLFLYYSTSPFGPWTPHPLNPVKTDVSSSRPAGNIQKVGGEYIRPAQNCSVTYGGSIALNRIDELTESAYSETRVGELQPLAAFPSGLHTISSSDRYCAIDGKRLIWTPLAWWYLARSRARTRRLAGHTVA